MIFVKIIKEPKGGISLHQLTKEKVDKLGKSHQRGKWYVIALGRGTHPKAMRVKDLPKKMQTSVRIALNVMGLW